MPNAPLIPALRPMREQDVPQVTNLLNTYLNERKVRIHFSEEEVRHFFVPRDKVVYAYVDGPSDALTDVFSFYFLPSQILNHPEHNMLNVAYSFYNVSTTGRLLEGMSDMLLKAKEEDFDVFNTLDVMENAPVFEPLNFKIGDGLLHYYLFNWRIKDITPENVGIVLV